MVGCGRPGAGELVDFHTRHKLIVLSHDETAYRELGRLVAEAGKGELGDTLQFDDFGVGLVGSHPAADRRRRDGMRCRRP